MSTGEENSVEQQRIELATRLREAREYVGMSQDDAAAVLGISRPAITLIESGGRKVEAVELGKLAKLYGRTIDFLLSGKESDAKENEKIAFLARATKGLSDHDLEQLGRFSEYLRSSSKPTRRGK